MMKKTSLCIFIVIACCYALSAENDKVDYVRYVNTLQGTDSDFSLSRGNTYPMTAMPFGMHGWSPQTGKNGDGWKYQYSSTRIKGFSQSHQCSPWCGDYAVWSLMPETGTLVVDEMLRGAEFSHSDEIGRPNYYKVKFDNGITSEIAPDVRSAHLRFSYPSDKEAFLVIDGYVGNSSFTINPDNNSITGWVDNHRFLNHPETFRCYIVIRFDKEFIDYGIWENQNNSIEHGKDKCEGKGCGVFLKFRKGTKVQVKTASSYISLEQAEQTLKQEVGTDKNLEATRNRGQEKWNELLGRIDVEGGSEEQLRTFYSCLFRSNLYSRIFYEIDENGDPCYYSPYDGLIHQGYMYTDNGLWDTFRSQFPLTNILHPTQQGRYMNALLSAQKECGWLPAWSNPGETGGMLGNHAISLLADAWAKGIRDFDPLQALKAYAHEAMNKGPWGGANGRAGWKDYFELGFVAFPESSGSTAQTLEYAYDDFCAWKLAKEIGNDFYADVFSRQMFNYRNVFDPTVGFMRGRQIDGEWLEPFDPYVWGGPYTEGNAWHYNWSVFHDIQGLINLYGSDKAFTEKIDSVFNNTDVVKPGWYGGMIHEMVEMQLAKMGQYAHGNQPIQHLAYLYSYAGQPWKTQYWVRQIVDRLYNSSEKGFPGDEDQGGMSSWYVLSALGIYAVTPGTDQYVIGSPTFKRESITLENGNVFTIAADENGPENVYIQSATLNGQPLDRNFITYQEIAEGGTLNLVMGPEPNRERNISKDASPFSLSKPECKR